MRRVLPYCENEKGMKGYSESEIAKKEHNDCVVRAFASAFNIPYEESHQFIKTKYKREHRKGTPRFSKITTLLSTENFRLGGKRWINYGTKESLKITIPRTGYRRPMTVGTFVKKHPTGTYIISVRQHVFTIKNGVIYGNLQDSVRTRKIIIGVWMVID